MIGRGLVMMGMLALVGCGGGSPTGATTRTPRACGVTCARLDARPPLAAVALEDGAIVVLGVQAEGGLIVVSSPASGSATAGGSIWDPRAVRPVMVAGDDTEVDAPLAAVADGERVVAVRRAPGGAHGLDLIAITREGVAATLAHVETPSEAGAVAVARASDGSFRVVWTADMDGAPLEGRAISTRGEVSDWPVARALPPRAGGRIALATLADGVAIARASEGGVELALPGAGAETGSLVVSPRPALEVALAVSPRGMLGIAWADEGGVWFASLDRRTAGAAGTTNAAGAAGTTNAAGAAGVPTARLVDDGDRTGEPAHRVGASLALAADPSAPSDVFVAAYQDQTHGSLVTADIGRLVTRREHASADRTRGFGVALVVTERAAIAFDVALRTRRALEGSIELAPLR